MSKVELIRRRNNHTARDKEVPDLPKVELFPRKNKSEPLIPAKGITKRGGKTPGVTGTGQNVFKSTSGISPRFVVE